MSHILSIDQSTSATKALLWDMNGKLISRKDIPHKQITNDQGWVEHDPTEIFRNTLESIKLLDETDISVLGISNQRETAVCWDRETGLPLYNAIVWQCARATDIVENIDGNMVREKTGLQLSPYFSAAKFGWMAKHVKEVQVAMQKGTACFGTIDSWLIFKLTGALKTDYSNASRTQLLNLHTLQWDEELVEAFGLRLNCLPEICMSDSLFGMTDLGGLLADPIPLHGVMGDSHAALFGNQCFAPYTAKATYGTGSSVMMNAGTACPTPPAGIVTSLAWGLDNHVTYVLEGNINYTGAVTKWLVEDVELIASSKEAGTIAQTVDSTGGVYLVPAFSGLGAPYFNSNARAALVGMNRATKKAHIVRAAEECIAYQIKDVVEAMGASLSVLRADGGPTKDGFLMQFQADMLNIPIEISETEELSGLGAAYCAAIGAGVSDRETLFKNQTRRTLKPVMENEQRNALYQGWKNAIKQIGGMQL